MEKLKIGQKFKHIDGSIGTFLYKGDEKYFFYSNEQLYYTTENKIAEVLDDYVDPFTINFPLMSTRKYVLQQNHRDLIHFALNNLKLKMQRETIGGKVYLKIKEIGRLIKGKVHYHETGNVYSVVGIEVKADIKYSFQDKVFENNGILPLHMGTNIYTCPSYFLSDHNKFKSDRYENGYGDFFEKAVVYEDLSGLDIDLEKYSLHFEGEDDE